MKYLLITLLQLCSVDIKAQTFVGALQPGDTLPISLNLGTWIEQSQQNSSYKLFEIKVSSKSKGGFKGATLEIHFDVDSVITGVLYSNKHSSFKNAEEELTNTFREIKNSDDNSSFKIVKYHRANPHILEDFNYFVESNGIKMIGYAQIKNVWVQEKFLINSSYRPRFINLEGLKN
jgi:hypothetical protein